MPELKPYKLKHVGFIIVKKRNKQETLRVPFNSFTIVFYFYFGC